MSLQGDLATLALPDLIQNLEMHRRSGTLVIETERETRRVYFKDGAIALFAGDGRPSLMDDLVRAGLITAKQLANARQPRWRRRRRLGEVLVQRKVIEKEALVAFGQARLIEDVCDFLALETGAFHFDEGRVPGGVFDPEERWLGLGLPVGPILFESARRKDHAAAQRGRVGREATYYVADGRPEPDTFPGDVELATTLCERLDGTVSVRELLQRFPHRRFSAGEALAALAAADLIHAASADDLAALAKTLADDEPRQALRVLKNALESTPRHERLLRDFANLSERLGDDEGAAEALKVLAHVQIEAEERERARENLTRACTLAPKDATIRARLLELSREDRLHGEAIEHGRVLVELYRGPGLHAKAVTVLEGLVDLAPDSWELRRDLARARVDSGNPTLAVTELRRHGKKLLSSGDDKAARAVQEEILSLVPNHSGAHKTIELIDNETFERRRATRRVLVRRLALVAVGVPLGLLLTFDLAARSAYAHATATVAELELIENRDYAAAAEVLEGVRTAYPFTVTGQLTIPRHVRALDTKRESGPTH